MTDKPTPTDAELNTILRTHWPAFARQSALVEIWVRDALQDAIDKLGPPDQKTVTVAPATGDMWLKHDDDLRYVRRVLEAGRQMTDVDQGAAIDMVQALRVTSAINGSCDAKKPAQAAEPVARLEIESLKAQLHAAKQINAAQFGLLAASIPGSALRASRGQAPATQQAGIPGNFITHRAAWREALETAKFVSTGVDRSYWDHELAAFDRSFDRLWTLMQDAARKQGATQ